MARTDSPLPDDEFYIGYEPPMPARMAARVAAVAAAIAGVAVAAAFVVLASHQRLSPSTFEFGNPRSVEGVLRRAPYPQLRVGGDIVWLVGPGKHGAEDVLAGVADGPVALRGTRAERRGRSLIEVVPGSVTPVGTRSVPLGSGTKPGFGTIVVPEGAETATKDVTLYGEIVDSKCFLGVMNPGEGTVHRDCARLCLRGGLPPMLLVRDADDAETLVLLVDREGRPIGTEIAALAGVPVAVDGRLFHDGDMPVLATDRSRVRAR